MLQIHSFTFNPFQENTYLLINEEKQVWIVDPGMFDNNETNEFNNFITANGLIPQAIINTHAHIDHILGIQHVKKTYNIPFLMHEKELPVLNGAPNAARMFGFSYNDVPKADGFIAETELLKLGKDELEVRFTPGHSPGSIVFYSKEGKWVIGGDVLFRQSIGRTDLPGGNHATLLTSIREQMFTLPDDTAVHSGHGPATTIGFEKKHNPYVR